ncbi:gamma-butyrobetaine hydroxylase-like domain-containing protein [Gilvimarinus sp. F26214L]|uniref:gamma-butyrobetaine hydroxylase-like domain-containing protein n=1 Tax=Gilvimarinus sp. DZF01 TaxID=3461371 RepID=UPI0040453D60
MTAPRKIHLHRKSRILEVDFASDCFQFPAEYLRVYSPSAEVKGHGPGQAVLQSGKQHVSLTGVERAGQYAVRLIFDDGHGSGIYTWDYLYELGRHQEEYWQDYLQRLEQAGKSRDPDTSAVKFLDP